MRIYSRAYCTGAYGDNPPELKRPPNVDETAISTDTEFVFPSCGTHRPLCEVAPRESAGALLGTLLGGHASQFGSRAICTVIDRFPVNDGPCLPSGAAKPCMVQTTPADSPRREVDRGTDAIFTFDERYNIDHIVPLHGHFCPIIGIQATHPRNAPRETSTAICAGEARVC